MTIQGRAVAIPNFGPCLLTLGSSGTSVDLKGSTQVALSNCTLYDNSSDSSAVKISGAATMSAYQVYVVGDISGASTITTTGTPGIQTGQSALPDPYVSTSFGSYSSLPCLTQNPSATTLSAGRYCSGISLNGGQSLTLNPGIYYIDGSSSGSGLTIAGNATLTGTGVTMVFTGSGSNWASATVSSNATIDLTAPTTGSTAGIVMFGDRNMAANTSFKLAGGSTQTLGGAVYLPKGALTFAGGSSANTQCTQLVAYTVSFTGNSNLAMNGDGYGLASTFKAMLVE